MGGKGQTAADSVQDGLISIFMFPIAGIRDLIRRNFPLEDHVLRLIQYDLVAFYRHLQLFHGLMRLGNIHQKRIDILQPVLFCHENAPVHHPDQLSFLGDQPVF